MKYEEKLDIILNAISDARKGAVKNQSAKIYINEGNGLSQIGKDETRDILYKLQVEENILSLNNTYNRLLPQAEQPQNLPYLLIDIRLGFDKWYSNYLITKKGQLEKLTESNFNEIYLVLTQIEEQLQFNRSEKFNFSFVSSFRDVEGYNIEDVDDLANGYLKVLEYLKKVGVVKKYSRGEMALDADIILNINQYYDLLDRAKKIKAEQKNSEDGMEKPKQASQTKMTIYDPSRGLLEIDGKKLKLNKDSFRAKLIELLLKDDDSRKKEWSWDEVIETIEGITDTNLLKQEKKRFYPACDGLAEQIAKKTGINDFITYTKSTVQINPIYIS